jgi:curved DNA-binding protein CbpA
MPTLYETLGVAPDATQAQIKAAFRNRAKTLHPDAGGGADEFAALCEAHDVLSDPERRRRYDETGSAAAQRTEAALEAQVLNSVYAIIAKALTDPRWDEARNDMAKIIRLDLAAGTSAGMSKIAEMKKCLAKARGMLDRFHGAPPKGGKKKKHAPSRPAPEIVGQTLRRVIAEITSHLEAMEQDHEVHMRVCAVFEAMDYNVDQAPEGGGPDQRTARLSTTWLTL